MCVCVSTKADSLDERIYLSKEEVGEILVREAERRRFRSSAEIPQLSPLKPAVQLTPTAANNTCLNNDDVLHQQLKTVSVRDGTSCNNVDIPHDGKQAKVQAINCPVISSRPGQQDDRMKTTKTLESVSSDCNLPGRSTADTTTTTSSCTPQSQENSGNVHNSSSAGCHVSMTSADSCSVPTVRLEANTTSAEAPQVACTAKKKKKTVTFSDNIELVASAADVTDTVDYMSYAASISRQASSTSAAKTSADSLPTTNVRADMLGTCCTNSDTAIASDSSDKMDVANCVAPSGQVRCSLCRQKWVELTDTYCSDCSFYLSKLQMST